uniref:GST C-terminal domain-containing protein n=1 Tax=Zea mays TaxID=4577 RepID=A0A804QP69_MAIZE
MQLMTSHYQDSGDPSLPCVNSRLTRSGKRSAAKLKQSLRYTRCEQFLSKGQGLISYLSSPWHCSPGQPPSRSCARRRAWEETTITWTLFSKWISIFVAALDKLEADLSKFDDGPFFLGQFSLADVAYITILERVQIYYSHLRNYDIAEGRPNLQEFIEEMNKIEAYAQTKNDPLFLLDLAKNHLKIA